MQYAAAGTAKSRGWPGPPAPGMPAGVAESGATAGAAKLPQ